MAELYHLGILTSAVPDAAVLVDSALPMGPVLGVTTTVPLASRREYQSHRAQWNGREILIASVGIGGPPLAIAIEELARCGTTKIILLGTAIFAAVSTPFLVPYGASRRDGTSAQYAPTEFPAVPDPGLRATLAATAGATASYGLVDSVDVLPDVVEPAGIAAAIDMRCATLFVVASAREVRAAALLTDLHFSRPTDDSVNRYRVGAMAEAALRSLTPHAGQD